MKPARLASVGVNKAADYYAAPEELLPPPFVPPSRPAGEPDDPEPSVPAPRPSVPTAKPKRPKSTLAKLQDLERALDAALEAGYQRFCRGEITATELNRRREELTRAFNRAVKAENIRYRGMLRR